MTRSSLHAHVVEHHLYDSKLCVEERVDHVTSSGADHRMPINWNYATSKQHRVLALMFLSPQRRLRRLVCESVLATRPDSGAWFHSNRRGGPLRSSPSYASNLQCLVDRPENPLLHVGSTQLTRPCWQRRDSQIKDLRVWTRCLNAFLNVIDAGDANRFEMPWANLLAGELVPLQLTLRVVIGVGLKVFVNWTLHECKIDGSIGKSRGS